MTDTSPAALRALAEHLKKMDPKIDNLEDFSAIWQTIDALRALAAEKEAEAPAPAPDGWIPWGGGDCPIETDGRVEVRFRDGDVLRATGPQHWLWEHFGGDGDIIAYRIAKEG